MLVDMLFAVTGVLIKIFNAIIPNWSLPEEMITALSYFGVYISKFNDPCPIADLFVVVGIARSVEIILMLVRWAAGFLSLIRGGGKIDI